MGTVLDAKHPNRKSAARVGVAVAGLALFAYLVLRSDISAAIVAIRGIGIGILLVMVPFSAAAVVHTMAWRLLFKDDSPRPTFLSLLGVTYSLEAVLMSLPGGALLTESLAPALLNRRSGVAASHTVASRAAMKLAILFSNGLYTLIAFLAGGSAVSAIAVAVSGHAALKWLVVAAAIGLVGAAIGLRAALVHGAIATRVHRLLGLLPSARARAWLAERERGFTDADATVRGSLADRPRSAALAVTLCLLGWLAEAVETYLILALLGCRLGFGSIMAIEVMASLLRSMAVAFPAGVGVQDAGYLAFFAAVGLPAATIGVPFLLVKRAKELLYIGVGYAALALADPAKERAHAF